jgi:hypothetical protein
VGIITLEDVIEELLGHEIIDETDQYIDIAKYVAGSKWRTRLCLPIYLRVFGQTRTYQACTIHSHLPGQPYSSSSDTFSCLALPASRSPIMACARFVPYDNLPRIPAAGHRAALSGCKGPHSRLPTRGGQQTTCTFRYRWMLPNHTCPRGRRKPGAAQPRCRLGRRCLPPPPRCPGMAMTSSRRRRCLASGH